LQLAGPQQPGQMLRIPAVGLDAITRRARNLAWRRHDTLHAPLGKLPRQAIAGRSGLVRDARRPWQPRAEPSRPRYFTVPRERLQLPGLSVQHRRDDRRRVHVQTDRLLAFAMAGFLPYAVVGRRTGTSRAARKPPVNSTGEAGHFYLQRRTNLNPYCLGGRTPPSH
jgi:hypothetical protein